LGAWWGNGRRGRVPGSARRAGAGIPTPPRSSSSSADAEPRSPGRGRRRGQSPLPPSAALRRRAGPVRDL